MVKRAFSSSTWFDGHVRDSFVRMSVENGYRARSSYKLIQMLDKYPYILHRKSVVLDCGASPGSWSQVVSERVESRVLSMDLLPMAEIERVDFIQIDVRSSFVSGHIQKWLDGKMFDLILSDMAPNISGIRDADSIRSVELGMQGLELAHLYLKPGGTLLTKIFAGGSEGMFEREMKRFFGHTKRIKPQASRRESAEIYFLCTGHKNKRSFSSRG